MPLPRPRRAHLAAVLWAGLVPSVAPAQTREVSPSPDDWVATDSLRSVT